MSNNAPLLKSKAAYEPVVVNMTAKEIEVRDAMRTRYQRRWSILIVLVVIMIMAVFVFIYLNARKIRPVEAFTKN